LRFHLSGRSHLIRIAIAKKTNGNNCWQGGGDKRILMNCWWGCKLVQPVWKSVWRVPQNLKIDLPCDLTPPLLGTRPIESKSSYHRNTCTDVFIAAPFTIAKLQNQPRCPSTGEWVKKIGIYIPIWYSQLLRRIKLRCLLKKIDGTGDHIN
jgi:hypothetical protein